MKGKQFTIALAGNPNCGKTTLFNALTGARQRIGNWPGVTVERKEGKLVIDDYEINVIDLPGIYSFSAFSLDEKVSREFILNEKPDVVVNIVDASNMERNLYLTTQLLEINTPMVVALNMMDVIKANKTEIELEHLATHLGCPVVPMVASKKSGLDELKKAILQIAKSHKVPPTQIKYDSVAEDAIKKIVPQVAGIASEHKVNKRWLAIKLLESDELALEITQNKFEPAIKEHVQKIEHHVGDEIDIILADGRYGFIHGLVKDVVHKRSELRKSVSDSIDKFVLNKFLGVGLFAAVMYLVFTLTINVGGAFIDFFDIFFGTIFVDSAKQVLTALKLPEIVVGLLADGVGGGIQTVATFIPPIFFIFISLSVLEESGYMARAAFIMDRFMRKIGLPGKAFIPMLVGFGCNVPAIMATRTLTGKRDRILTILLNPFMSCGARLPVYALFIAAFFPQSGGSILFSLYAIGIVLAIVSGFIFKSTILKGNPSTFVMELPPYHIPTFNGVMLHTFHRVKSFVFHAGKVILLAVVILSSLNTIQISTDDGKAPLLEGIGKAITPVFSPMGIDNDNWEATVGLFMGLFAKEAVVGSLDALYTQNQEEEGEFDFWGGIKESFETIPANLSGLVNSGDGEEEELSSELLNSIKTNFGTPIKAYAYLLFILIYAPCVAVIGAVHKETNFKWAMFSVGYLTSLAWLISTVFYQLGSFFEHPGSSGLWLLICAAIFGGGIWALKIFSRDMIIEDDA